MRDVTLQSMKNKSVHSCRFVHHAKFHCIMTTLNKLFKIKFERAGGNWKRAPKDIPSAKNGYCKIVQRGDPLGRQGVESLRKKASTPPPPPPLNLPLAILRGMSKKTQPLYIHSVN